VWVKRRHHRVFSCFHRWAGRVPAGFDIDFLGTRSRTDFCTTSRPQPEDRFAAPSHPPFDEEYFEWIDLLEAVVSANDRFTMLELGAGWGRWTARAAAAAQQRGLAYTLVAVEAEPTHFQWLAQNLQDNAIKLDDCRLVQAAVTAKDGTVCFQVGDAPTSYGQSIGGNTEVKAVSLATLLQPFEFVDLIDMDVQSAELDILAAATEPLSQKVRRVHVETHSEQLHTAILTLFQRLGWQPHFLYGGNTADKTPWGRINFQGGTQSWLNPRLHSPTELRDTPTLQNSLGRRGLTTGRRVLNRVAPVGTARRRAFLALISPLVAKYRRDPEDASRRPVDWHRPTT
jgi:FkbM family methyltransferase